MALGGQFPLSVQQCAAPWFPIPVQNASSPTPPVAMVIAVEPGLHLASPAGAERPLTAPRGLLGSEAGLPGAVTQPDRKRRPEPWTPGGAPGVSERGREDGGYRLASRWGGRPRGSFGGWGKEKRKGLPPTPRCPS